MNLKIIGWCFYCIGLFLISKKTKKAKRQKIRTIAYCLLTTSTIILITINELEVGKMKSYRHFKGNIYYKIAEAKHTETSEILVIYKNSSGEVFARPREMFEGFKEKSDGSKIKRFTLIEGE